MMRKRFVIVGAGVGGLSLALRLAHRGHDVVVLEKNSEVGGRNRSERVGECRFDMGPTLLMMLDPFRKLFADVGECFDERLQIQLCDPIYRAYFADGSRIDATSVAPVMEARLRSMAGDRDAAAYRPFLVDIKHLYEEAVPNFVRKNYRSLSDVAAPAQVGRVARHGMLSNLAKRVEKRFADPRARMLFSFQTMYLGLSPYDAPWVYATLAHMEYGEGIWYPKGGMAAISEAIANLARERGAEIWLGAEVAAIRGCEVELKSGETLTGDAIIANADMPYAQRELAGEQSRRRLRYSCSAHLMYIDYGGELPGLGHHSVFFGADFKGNLDALFHKLAVPRDPAFYTCLSMRSEPVMAPPGHSNLFILVPVPNLDRPMTPGEVKKIEGEVFGRLSREMGFDPTRILAVKRRGPTEWREELNLDKGAAFGISHDLFQSAFMRPPNKCRTNPHLYFVGASTTPGNGLPMVLISAELVESRLLEEGVIAA